MMGAYVRHENSDKLLTRFKRQHRWLEGAAETGEPDRV